MSKEHNNQRAEAEADQFWAAVRDDQEPAPNLNLKAIAARTCHSDKMPPALRKISEELLQDFAEEENVDRPEE